MHGNTCGSVYYFSTLYTVLVYSIQLDKGGWLSTESIAAIVSEVCVLRHINNTPPPLLPLVFSAAK